MLDPGETWIYKIDKCTTMKQVKKNTRFKFIGPLQVPRGSRICIGVYASLAWQVLACFLALMNYFSPSDSDAISSKRFSSIS